MPCFRLRLEEPRSKPRRGLFGRRRYVRLRQGGVSSSPCKSVGRRTWQHSRTSPPRSQSDREQLKNDLRRWASVLRLNAAEPFLERGSWPGPKRLYTGWKPNPQLNAQLAESEAEDPAALGEAGLVVERRVLRSLARQRPIEPGPVAQVLARPMQLQPPPYFGFASPTFSRRPARAQAAVRCAPSAPGGDQQHFDLRASFLCRRRRDDHARRRGGSLSSCTRPRRSRRPRPSSSGERSRARSGSRRSPARCSRWRPARLGPAPSTFQRRSARHRRSGAASISFAVQAGGGGMARRDRLNDDERRRLFGVPESEAELIRHYTLIIAPLTVGQAQKLASIFLKYGFALTHAEPRQSQAAGGTRWAVVGGAGQKGAGASLTSHPELGTAALLDITSAPSSSAPAPHVRIR